MTCEISEVAAEVSSDHFRKQGGIVEILQLWLNLPARLKMTDPFYRGLQKEEIPKLTLDGGKVVVDLISGRWGNVEGAFRPLTDVHLNTIYFKPGGKLDIRVPLDRNIFFLSTGTKNGWG